MADRDWEVDPDLQARRAPAAARVSYRASLAVHHHRRGPDATADLDAHLDESPAAVAAEAAVADEAADSDAPPAAWAAAAAAADDAAAVADASSSPAGHTKDAPHSSGPNSRRD